MTSHPHRPRSSRRAGAPLFATLLVVALAALGCGDSTEPTSEGLAHVRSVGGQPTASDPSDPSDPGVPGVPDGPNGLLDTGRPTIGNLDPDLLEALEAAARDARDDGVTLGVTSGWRSRAHQQQLYDEAVSKYGSEEEARRYVSTPDTSAHVTGDAVDIGPTEADDWLNRHGAAYGLCQMFANEIWHFELATTPGGECPEMLPDSSYRG